MGIFDFFKRKSKDNQPLSSDEIRQLLSSEVRQAIREELNASGLLQNKSTRDVKDDDSKSREYVHQIASLLRKHIIVEPVQDTRKMFLNSNMIERSLIVGGTVSSAFYAILSIVAMKEASGTLWKVVFPKGISGQLMQMANGLYTTSIVGEGGKILAQAGLIPVMGNLFPSLLAFSGITQFVTFATIVFYSIRIEKSLKSIERNMNRLVEMFVNQKVSEVSSAFYFYKDVFENFEVYISNEQYRLATLTNVQKLNILLHSNIIFFDKETSKEVERAFEDIRNSFTAKGAVKRVDEDIRKVIVPYIYYLYSSFYTYTLGKILESVLSSSTYNTYFDNLLVNIYETRNVLEKQIKGLIDLIDKELKYRVENAWFSKEKHQSKIEAIRKTLTDELTMLNGEIENFIGRAKHAHKMLSQPFEIIVGDNRIYLPDVE